MDRILIDCVDKECGLYTGDNKVISGSGNVNYNLMIIGEAPGGTEVKLGKPFVGRSGMLLTESMKKAGINREYFYVTNIVKCRPPNNRTPSWDEINSCRKHLLYEMSQMKPLIIVTLGSTATSYFIKNRGMKSSIGKLFVKRKDMIEYYVYPVYHPSYILRGGLDNKEYINLFMKLKSIVIKLLSKKRDRLNVILNGLEG